MRRLWGIRSKSGVRILRQERGFTLIETLLATAISALLISSLGMTIYQMSHLTRMQQDALSTNHALQGAMSMLNRDVVSAATGRVQGNTLTLHAPTYVFGQAGTPVTRTVTYTLSSASLVRSDGQSAVTVARNVQSIQYGPLDPTTGAITTTLNVTLTVQLRDQVRTATVSFQRRPQP
jgi:prepilin-type N-terminal cleavage/methylation domain-containing protein